jgi:hypothetical protein
MAPHGLSSVWEALVAMLTELLVIFLGNEFKPAAPPPQDRGRASGSPPPTGGDRPGGRGQSRQESKVCVPA